MNRNRLLLILFITLPIVFVILLKTGAFRANGKLPIYGERFLPEGAKDTLYHTVGEFDLTDQKNSAFTHNTVKGKIRVVNFFFARCKGICPKMNGNTLLVFDKYKNSPDIIFISHTVDPEHDTAQVLDAYATQMGAKYKRWYFVTGTYANIAQIQNQYLLPKANGSSADQIAHSQHIILVDKEDRVRGAYDGLNINEVQALKEDIKLLLNEYRK